MQAPGGGRVRQSVAVPAAKHSIDWIHSIDWLSMVRLHPTCATSADACAMDRACPFMSCKLRKEECGFCGA